MSAAILLKSLIGWLILRFSLNSIALQAYYVTVVENRPIMSVKYCLPVPVFYFWRKFLLLVKTVKRTLQCGLSAIAEHLVAFYYTETLLYSNFRGPLFSRTCQAREKNGFYSSRISYMHNCLKISLYKMLKVNKKMKKWTVYTIYNIKNSKIKTWQRHNYLIITKR